MPVDGLLTAAISRVTGSPSLQKHNNVRLKPSEYRYRVREMLERLKQECSQTDKHKIEDK